MLRNEVSYSSNICAYHTCVDNSSEEIVENVAKPFGVEHAVECANEHGLLRVELLRLATHEAEKKEKLHIPSGQLV